MVGELWNVVWAMMALTLPAIPNCFIMVRNAINWGKTHVADDMFQASYKIHVYPATWALTYVVLITDTLIAMLARRATDLVTQDYVGPLLFCIVTLCCHNLIAAVLYYAESMTAFLVMSSISFIITGGGFIGLSTQFTSWASIVGYMAYPVLCGVMAIQLVSIGAEHEREGAGRPMGPRAREAGAAHESDK